MMQAVTRSIFDPKNSDRSVRLSGFEKYIYGDISGYRGGPRLLPLGAENENYNRYERTKVGELHKSVTITSGYEARAAGDPNSHQQSHLFVGLCTRGQAMLDTQKESVKLNEGDMYINMASNYRIRYDPGTYERLVIPKSMISDHANKIDEFLVMRAGDPVADLLRTTINSLAARNEHQNPEQLAIVSEVATTVSQRVVQNLLRRSQRSGDEIILNRAIEYISDNIVRSDLTVAEVVSYCGTSRAALYRAFESFGGVAHYISSQRVERAKHMLRSGPSMRGAVLAACYSCGFTDPGNFSNVFKRHVGMSPSAYIRCQT